MSAIAWWVLPIVATIGAIAYVTWRGKPRPPEDTHEAMEARERFRRAIESPTPSHGRRPRPTEKGIDGDDSADGGA